MGKVVIPGEELPAGRPGRNVYQKDGKNFSTVIGIPSTYNGYVNVVPLGGVYSPKVGDNVIGVVEDITSSLWIIDINAPYSGVLTLSEGVDEFVDLTKTDITKYYDYGDVLFMRVNSVTRTKSVYLSMKARGARKLIGGRLIKVSPVKVPRIIGKGGSMVEMIKEKTNCQIVVGQNGVVWVKGEGRERAIEAIMEIERNSHMSGLTNYISNMLDSKR